MPLEDKTEEKENVMQDKKKITLSEIMGQIPTPDKKLPATNEKRPNPTPPSPPKNGESPVKETKRFEISSIPLDQEIQKNTDSFFSGDTGTPAGIIEDSDAPSPIDPFSAVANQEITPPVNPFLITPEQNQAFASSLDDVRPPPTGFKFQPIGAEIVKTELSRFRFTTGRVYRGAILFDDQMGVARYHYDRKVGSFFCFGGSCCKKYRNPNIRIVLPWISYDTDKKGNVISKEVISSFLQFTEDDYNEQVKCYTPQGKLSRFDFQAICTDEKFQKVVLTILNDCYWRKDQQITEQVTNKFKKLWQTVPHVIAKTLTEAELIEALNQPSQNIKDSQEYSQTDITRYHKR